MSSLCGVAAQLHVPGSGWCGPRTRPIRCPSNRDHARVDSLRGLLLWWVQAPL